MNLTSVPEPDPALVAALNARVTARGAHHEAGHAVAAVARGGKLKRISLGTVDWSTPDGSADTNGFTVHETAYAEQPFVTFAGPVAEAWWAVEHDDDVDDLSEALEYAWLNNTDGDTAKYEYRVAMLEGVAAQLGFSRVGRAWEDEWFDGLEPLRPAVREVAALLIDGDSVTHEVVQAAVDRCRR
jgi:hypothetical protein